MTTITELEEADYGVGDELTIDVEMGDQRGTVTVEITDESRHGGYLVAKGGTKLGRLRDKPMQSSPGVAAISPDSQYGDYGNGTWPVYEIEVA